MIISIDTTQHRAYYIFILTNGVIEMIIITTKASKPEDFKEEVELNILEEI